MKKRKKILWFLLITAVALAAVAVWQWDNLKALRLSSQLSGEDLASQMEDTMQRVTESSQSISGVTVRDLTDEEKAALKSNTLSGEEVVDLLIGNAPSEATAEPSVPQQDPASVIQTPQVEAAPSVDPNREKLSRLLAEIYVMQAEYTSWLESMNQAAIDEYVALPEAERTAQNKFSIGFRYMDMALKKEKECDAKMAEKEAAIREVLHQLGEDDSLVDEIHAAYLEEKTLKKAYYLNLH